MLESSGAPQQKRDPLDRCIRSLVESDFESRLASLRDDFAETVGEPFGHFYCPILYRDEDVPLCRGHLINQVFPRSSRRWTVQRADVDSRFGSLFESAFVHIRHKGQHSTSDLVANRELMRHFNPEILVDGQPVDHYVTKEPVPSTFTGIELPSLPPGHKLVLKLEPSKLISAKSNLLEVRGSFDLQLPALASLLKAAHLTLFDMLGYRYALSAGGHEIGWGALGSFHLRTASLSRGGALSAAVPHFRQFVNLLRPVAINGASLMGTASDQHLYFLQTGVQPPWGFLVLVRTQTDLHGVIVPTCVDPDGAARYADFLKADSAPLQGYLAILEDNKWLVSTKVSHIEWPLANISDLWETAV